MFNTESMMAPKNQTQETQKSSQENITTSEKLVNKGVEIVNDVEAMPEGPKKNKARALVAGFTTALAGGMLGVYKLSESFQSSMNEQIQKLQSIDWNSEEGNQIRNVAIGAVAVSARAGLFLKMKSNYEKSQQDNLA